MYKYHKGLGQIWVDSVPPPKDATNVLWLRFPQEFGVGEDARFIRFELKEDGILYVVMKYKDTDTEEDWIQLTPFNDKGFELLVFVNNAGMNSGEWFPIQGTRGKRGPSGVVVSDTEPEDPEIQIWVDPTEDPDNIFEVELTMEGSSDNPVSKNAIKEYIESMIAELPNQGNNPIIL